VLSDRTGRRPVFVAGAAVLQALAPLLAGLVIAQLGGYGVLFAAAGVFTVLGALSVGRIPSVQ
jgi:MFS family permease